MKIEVLGPGCARCRAAFDAVSAFVLKHGITAEVHKVEQIEALLAHGIIALPAIVLDGKPVLKGRVPSERDLERILKRQE